MEWCRHSTLTVTKLCVEQCENTSIALLHSRVLPFVTVSEFSIDQLFHALKHYFYVNYKLQMDEK